MKEFVNRPGKLEKLIAILKAGNPGRSIAATASAGWVQQQNGEWACLLALGGDEILRFFEPGDKTLTIEDSAFRRYMSPAISGVGVEHSELAAT